mgnify:CR=1 FL=1
MAQEGADPAKSPQSDIVVSGMRDGDRNRAIDDFARQLTDSSAVSPMAFYEPGDFCPGVVGLSARANAAIAARMHAVAAAAQVEPGDPVSCQTSALVVFVDDTQTAITRFRSLHPQYFAAVTGEEITFQGMGTPVAGWKLLARVDRNGNPVGVDENGIQTVETPAGTSRLQSSTKVVTAMSVLIISKSQVLGLTTQQIADYALMRAVTDTDPKALKVSRTPTILAVLDAEMGQETPALADKLGSGLCEGPLCSQSYELRRAAGGRYSPEDEALAHR